MSDTRFLGQLRIAFLRMAQQGIGVDTADDGIAARVEPVHLGQRGLHHLMAGHLSLVYRTRQVCGAEIGKVCR
jgi:hypothetical protein